MTAYILFLGAILFSVHQTYGWDNDYDGLLHKECPSGQVFTGVTSIHHNSPEDRLYTWHCTPRSAFKVASRSCYWSDVNQYDRPLDYNCRSGYAMVGVISAHSNYHQDRIFKFKCCKPSTSRRCRTRNAHKTAFVNDFDGYFSYFTRQSITGAYSEHSSRSEDRRWKFRTGVIKCSTDPDDACSCPSVATSDWSVDDVQYKLNQGRIAALKPVVLTTKTIDNRYTNSKSIVKFSASETQSSSYSFSRETGMELTISMSFKTGLPLIVRTTAGISLGVSHKATRKKEQTVTKTFSSESTLEVASRSYVRAEVLVQRDKIDVPYMMRLKNRKLGCTCYSNGTWQGVDVHNLHMKTVDLNNIRKLGNNPSTVRYYGFDAFNFPSSEVPESPRWTAKTKAECLESCHGEGDCEGVVRETDLGDEGAGNCYLITSGVVNNCKALEDTDDDKKFTIWLAYGIKQACYERPTTDVN